MSAPIPERWREWYEAVYPERLVSLPVLKDAIKEIADLEARLQLGTDALKECRVVLITDNGYREDSKSVLDIDAALAATEPKP